MRGLNPTPNQRRAEGVMARVEWARAASARVPPVGEPVLEFEARNAGGRTPIVAHASPGGRWLVWQVDAEAPATLLLHDARLDGVGACSAALEFAAPLLPRVGAQETQSGWELAALSADGALHVVVVCHEGAPLAAQLASGTAVHTLPLAAAWERLGEPTCLNSAFGDLFRSTEKRGSTQMHSITGEERSCGGLPGCSRRSRRQVAPGGSGVGGVGAGLKGADLGGLIP